MTISTYSIAVLQLQIVLSGSVSLLLFLNMTFFLRRECEKYVKGFPGARFKKFSTNDEAQNFVHGSDSGFSNNYTATASYVSTSVKT